MSYRCQWAATIAVLAIIGLHATASGAEPRRILTGRYSQEDLARILASQKDFKPFPKAGDAAWKKIPAGVLDGHVSRAEVYLGMDWPSLPATLFLDYQRTGNRSRYQEALFERRTRLAYLVLGESIENQGRFLDQILNGVWLICEESYWGVPAHVAVQEAGRGLPDVKEPTVDLFAAETSSLLAWTWYLLGDQLEDLSPLVGDRIRYEVDRRILTPALERHDFWWMGYRGRRLNNWNPWINSNWLASVLLLEDDPDRRVRSVYKIIQSLDFFLDSYPEDGGCDEGPGYWNRAGGSLYDNLELLFQGTEGQLNVFDVPLIREIGRYIYRSYIGNGYFVNFADASARAGIDPSLVFRYGKAVDDETLKQMGAWFAGQEAYGSVALKASFGGLARLLPALFSLEELLEQPASEPLVRESWLPDLGVLFARETEGSTSGFSLAAKAGHNDESHNHNDVGNLVVFFDGEPVVIDPGVGTYTAQTFSRRRYEIWTMQSSYHNLPAINGVMQAPGREYQARDVRNESQGRSSRITMDLSSAYPDSAHVKRWQRSVSLERGSGVDVVDTFELSEATGATTWSWMTPATVRLAPGQVAFGMGPEKGVRLVYDSELLEAALERIELDDPRLSSVWGDHLNRILVRLKEPVLRARIEFRFEAGVE